MSYIHALSVFAVAALIVLSSSAIIKRSALAALSFTSIVWLIYLLIDKFSRDGLNEVALAHLHVVTQINTLVQFWPWAMALIFLLSLVFLAHRSLDSKISKESVSKTHKIQIISTPMSWILLVALLTTSLASHPVTEDILRIKANRDWSAKYALPEQYATIDALTPALTYQQPAEADSSFVFIFAESLEETLFDESTYPNLMPELSELVKSKGKTYSGIIDLPLSNWTYSGMVGILCGEIMEINNGQNISTCIGNLLKKAGYRLEFSAGSEFGWEDKSRLLMHQGFDQLFSPEEIRANLGRTRPNSDWGLQDYDLFVHNARRLDALNSGELKTQPFGLFLLTVDTHDPGFIPDACTLEKVQFEDNSQFLNSVRCQSQLIADFINTTIRKHPNVTIFLASDHLYPGELSSSKKSRQERGNILVVFNQERETSEIVNRPSSVLDLAPTILDELGFEINNLNLGRNLNQPAPTLTESLGVAILAHNSPHIRKLLRGESVTGDTSKTNVKQQLE